MWRLISRGRIFLTFLITASTALVITSPIGSNPTAVAVGYPVTISWENSVGCVNLTLLTTGGSVSRRDSVLLATDITSPYEWDPASIFAGRQYYLSLQDDSGSASASSVPFTIENLSTVTTSSATTSSSLNPLGLLVDTSSFPSIASTTSNIATPSTTAQYQLWTSTMIPPVVAGQSQTTTTESISAPTASSVNNAIADENNALTFSLKIKIIVIVCSACAGLLLCALIGFLMYRKGKRDAARRAGTPTKGRRGRSGTLEAKLLPATEAGEEPYQTAMEQPISFDGYEPYRGAAKLSQQSQESQQSKQSQQSTQSQQSVTPEYTEDRPAPPKTPPKNPKKPTLQRRPSELDGTPIHRYELGSGQSPRIGSHPRPPKARRAPRNGIPSAHWTFLRDSTATTPEPFI